MWKKAAQDLQQFAAVALRAGSELHVTPAALAAAPQKCLAALQRRGFSSGAGNPEGPSAFVFDIDGVLIRGGTVLPAARRALAKLYEPGGEKPKLPVCFLTNGGGVTEATKAEELSSWLDVQVHENQVVLAHTPFRRLAQHTPLRDKPVLVAGVGSPAEVARHYGFRQVLTLPQLHAAQPHSAPFAVCNEAAEPGAGDMGSEGNPIAGVLVFKDPNDWYRDTQLVLDVLTSGGVPGRDAPPEGAEPVQLYFANPDMLWANEFPTPRLGQGAFAACIKLLYREVTGRELPHLKYYGKPNPAPYRLMEALLLQQAQLLDLVDGDSGSGSADESPEALDAERPAQPLPFSSVFAVGDNPAADVRGANRAGPPWVSVLVRTGVFRGGKNSDTDPAQIVVNDVEAAVEAGLHRTRSLRWHSMR